MSEVREVQGVVTFGGWVKLIDGVNRVLIAAPGGQVNVSSAEARYLADQLYHLADRVELRELTAGGAA